MPPLSYPDLSWSGRTNRFVRTLRVVAIAVAVGAAGGVVGAVGLLSIPTGPRDARIPAGADHARALAPASSASDVTPQPGSKPQSVIASQPQDAKKAEAVQTVPAGPSVQPAAPPMPPAATLAATPPSQQITPPPATVTPPVPAAQKRAAAANEPASRHLYDRAEAADSARGSADGSAAVPNSVAAHARQKSRHARKSALARTTPYSPTPQSRYASRAIDEPPPPVAIAPPPRRAYGREGEDGYTGNWRHAPRREPRGYAGRNDWRDRRPDYDRRDDGRGPGNLLNGLFGFFSGD